MPAVLPMMDPQPLLNRLAAARRSWQAAEAARAVGTLAAVALGGPSLAAFLDVRFQLPPLARAIFLVGWLVALAFTWRRFVSAPLARPHDDLTIALRVERRYPALNDALASAVQFLTAPVPDRFGSADLRRATIQRALRQANRCDFRAVVRVPGTRRAVLLGLLAAFAAGIGLLAAPATAATALARFADPFGAHPWPPRTRVTVLKPTDASLRAVSGRPVEILARLDGVLPEQARLQVWLADEAEPLDRPLSVEPAPDGTGAVSFLLEPSDIPKSFRYRLAAGDGDSGWRSVELATPPELTLWDGRPSPLVSLTFPTYSGLLPAELPDGGRMVKALAGTRVRLRAATDRPISRAAVLYLEKPGEPFRFAPLGALGAGGALQVPGLLLGGAAYLAPVPVVPTDEGHRLDVTLILPQSGTYALVFADAAGVANSVEFDVRVLPDPAPRVSLDRPAAVTDSLNVLPTGTITLKVKADDLLDESPGRIRRLALEYRLATAPPFAAPGEQLLFDYARAARLAELARGFPADLPLPAANLASERRVPVTSFTKPDGSAPKAGDTIVLQAVGTDFDDYSWAKAPGRSQTVELRVVAAPELEGQLQQGQANLRRELLRLQQWQREASAKANDALKSLRADGKLTRPAQDQIFDAEQTQQRLRERVGTGPEGLRGEANRLRQALRDNPLPQSATKDRVESVAGDLDKLAREQLEPLEGLLAEARKPDESPGPPKQLLPLTEARQKQREAERALAGLLEKLEPWSGANEVRGEARGLLDQQKQLEPKTAELLKQNKGRAPEDLTKEQQGELDRAAEKQARQAELLAELRQKMSRLSAEKGQEAERRAQEAKQADAQAAALEQSAAKLTQQAGAAKKLQAEEQRDQADAAKAQANDLRDRAQALRQERDALKQALAADRTPGPDGQTAAERLAEAAQQMRKNQLGSAAAGQQQAAAAVEKMIDALDEQKAAPADQARADAKQTDKQLNDLLNRQEDVQRRAEEAQRRPQEAQEEMGRRKQELQRRQKEEREQAEKNPDPKQRAADLAKLDQQHAAELKAQEQQGLEEMRKAQKDSRAERQQLAEEQRELARQAKETAERLRRQQSPAAKAAEQAAEQMTRAAQQLDDGEPAERTQDDALDKLDEAKQAVQEQREQSAQGELQREQREKIVERVRGLQGRQKSAVIESKRLHETLGKAASFSDALADSFAGLRQTQEQVRDDARTLATEKFAPLPVFAELLKLSAESLDDAATRLDQRLKDRPDANKPLDAADREAEDLAQKAIVKAQETALRRLTQLLDAVKDDPADHQAAKKQQPPPGGGAGGGGGGGGGGPPGESIPPRAQLKALRALQAEVNERTAALAKEFPDEANRPDDAVAEIEQLQQAESKLLDLLREFEPPAARPEGDQP